MYITLGGLPNDSKNVRLAWKGDTPYQSIVGFVDKDVQIENTRGLLFASSLMRSLKLNCYSRKKDFDIRTRRIMHISCIEIPSTRSIRGVGHSEVKKDTIQV